MEKNFCGGTSRREAAIKRYKMRWVATTSTFLQRIRDECISFNSIRFNPRALSHLKTVISTTHREDGRIYAFEGTETLAA